VIDEPQDEQTPAEETPQDAPAEETPAEEAPAEETPVEAEAPEAEDEAVAEEEAPAAEEAAPAPEQPQPDKAAKPEKGEEVIPGADLEPDLVLEEQKPEGEFGEYAEDGEEGSSEDSDDADSAPVAREPLDLAADARYRATGKRKSAVARVVLRPGDGTYSINGRHLDEFFPRIKLQRMAQQPLEVAGYGSRMNVSARIHGGGVASQAGALRHGIARALVEADPNLRLELKKRGYLTRDPRVKERKKAGLKKARKRPQFSKR
jgi:small subunit ribosomal protein S9